MTDTPAQPDLPNDDATDLEVGVPVRTTVVSVPPPARGDALGFSVQTELLEGGPDADGEAVAPTSLGRYARATVNVRVNGRALLAADQTVLFDAGRVLVRQDAPCVFDPYTCGCGEAGCAGIFRGMRQALATTTDPDVRGQGAQDVPMPLSHAPCTPHEHHLAMTAGTVLWRFPLGELGDGGFLGRLSEGWPVVDGAYELRFERAHFQAAVEALRAHLEALDAWCRETLDAPTALMPDHDPSWVLQQPRPLLGHLAQARESFEEHQAQESADRAAYGALYDQSLEAVLPNGRRYAVHLSSLGYLLAERALGLDSTVANDPGPVQDELRARIAPAWRDDPSSVLPALQSLPGPMLDDVTVLIGYGPADGEQGETLQELDEAALRAQWAQARLVWSTFDA